MEMCDHPGIAIRVHRRTMFMIQLLDNDVSSEIPKDPHFFMIYCADSDHEEYQIIDKDTYDRRYGEMPPHVLVQYVTTID